MVATVAVTVATHNLAIGVVVGVLVAMTLFARRVAHLTETHRELVENARRHHLRGLHRHRRAVLRLQQRPRTPSSSTPTTPTDVVIDLSRSHIWDASTVASLDAITTKYAAQGQDRRNHRAQRLQRRTARPAHRGPALPLVPGTEIESSPSAGQIGSHPLRKRRALCVRKRRRILATPRESAASGPIPFLATGP